MKTLAIIAGGLGNQIQMTAAIRTLRERLGLDIEVLSGGAPTGSTEIRQWLPYETHRPAWRPLNGDFSGAVVLGFASWRQTQDAGWQGLPWLNQVDRQVVRYEMSEVDVSMNACRDLGVAEDDLIWHGEMNCDETYDERFDVVLANNYYKGTPGHPNDHWHVKGYPGFKSLASAIRDKWPNLSMCCIGLDRHDAIEGVTDRTGTTLGGSLALIKRAKFLVTTDSMAFHAAACFDTKAFALWTATSVIKNACPKFHATAVLLERTDLECRRDCQEASHRWTSCRDWKCQEIGIGQAMKPIVAFMEGQA